MLPHRTDQTVGVQLGVAVLDVCINTGSILNRHSQIVFGSVKCFSTVLLNIVSTVMSNSGTLVTV